MRCSSGDEKRRVNNVPEAPTKTTVSPKTNVKRSLDFWLEKEIANNLAFLSVTSDDSRKVMAVCVEEHINGEGITIRIASNTEAFSEAAVGFRKIGVILERVARRREYIRQVIALDIDRILSRLRSRHTSTKRKAGKPAIITQLYDAINDESVKSTASLTDRSQGLQDLFTELEGIPDINASTALTHRLVRNIVAQAYILTSTTDLDLLFRDSKLQPPSLISHIPLAFGKLSRYYSATRSLICAARDPECRVFRTVVIEPFHTGIPSSLHEDGIKVHAEIQLLFFYELHPDLPRPRIICASKSACYLCNLFFRLHGVFQVPRSHGKLYPQWTLPDWLPILAARHAELANLTTRLKAALDSRAKLPRGTRHTDPNESVVSLPWSWPPSTIHKSLSSIATTSTIRPRSPLHQEGTQDAVLSQLSSMPPTPPWTPSAQISTPISSPLPLIPEEPVQTPSSSHCITITPTQLPYSASITSLTPPLLLHFDQPPLKLDFDFSHASPCRLLITKGAETAGEGGEYRVVDIEDIPTATEFQVAPLERKPREVKFQLQGVCVAVTWGLGVIA
ncbi:hypothetical protein V493_08027 [Pseudogymnoascus sp. VKM F-4281 (FW-2241)]|nr:hypothetical protein V493_08027 [Pseudogymnoascus sp. VKM F-4281 (FW-2241)]